MRFSRTKRICFQSIGIESMHDDRGMIVKLILLETEDKYV